MTIDALKTHAAKLLAAVAPDNDGIVKMPAKEFIDALYFHCHDYAAVILAVDELIEEGKVSLQWKAGCPNGEIADAVHRQFANSLGFSPPSRFEHCDIRVEKFDWIRTEVKLGGADDNSCGRWLYERRHTEGTTWNAIFSEYESERAKHGWPKVKTANALRQRTVRYAELNGLTLRQGKGGRPAR
jgi:hypothetical protein